MGSSNSRQGGSGHHPPARPHHPHPQRRRPSFRRNLSSLLICGASSSHPNNRMEDDPAELLVNSAEQSDVDKIRFPIKTSSEKAICVSGGDHSSEDVSRISETRKSMESMSKQKGPHSSVQLTDNPRSNETIGMSSHSELSSDSLIAVRRKANSDDVDNGKGKINETASGNSKSSYGSSSDAVESFDEMSPENEVMIFRGCDFTSGSAPSESSLDFTLQTSSSGVGSSVADMEDDQRNENELQIDRAITSSHFPSNNSSGRTSHEARRSNRRLFWDSFSRRNFRRNGNSRTFLFGADDNTEGFGFQDRSHFDLSGDIFDYEIGGSSRSHRRNNQSNNEQRMRSSSEVWERSRDLENGSDRRTTFCPSGVHPDGSCSCSSILTADESGARASISRIVMLAEALFEVLDEVHRQPLSLSLSMVSLPAPETVVDSLPVKNYSELERTEGKDEFTTQCHICLAEYDEGDAIRVLPCHHEFHVACVDKWLKEIHGVCPLCRGNVREGSLKGSASF